ncbi:MAG: hypothetical protein PHV77_01820 [Candidatus Omnitrophica bacterium]|nr:hypothetical protein [Candidatus Omnitrophota bacterium]
MIILYLYVIFTFLSPHAAPAQAQGIISSMRAIGLERLLRPVSAALARGVEDLAGASELPSVFVSPAVTIERNPLLEVLAILEEHFYDTSGCVTVQDVRRFWHVDGRGLRYVAADIRTALRLLEQLGILSRPLSGAGFLFTHSPYKQLNEFERDSLKRKLAAAQKHSGILYDNAGYGTYIARQLSFYFKLFPSDSKEEFMFNIICSVICDKEKFDRFVMMFVRARNEFELDNIVQFARDSKADIGILILRYIFSNFDTDDEIVEGLDRLVRMPGNQGAGIRDYLIERLAKDANSKNARALPRQNISILKMLQSLA